MAKSSKKRKEAVSQPAKQTKKQIAIGRKQARQNRIILFSLAGLAVLILIVLGIGIVQELVIKPASPVATVNGTKIPIGDYEDLLRYRRYTTHVNILNLENELESLDPDDETNQFLISFYQQQLGQLQSSLALASQDVLDEMIEDALIQQKAEEAGLRVTNEDVTQRIDEDLELAVSGPPQEPITGTEEIATPTPVPREEMDELYQNALGNMGLTDGEFRGILQRSLYRTAVQDLLAGEVPTTGLVAHVQLIQTGTEEEATAALERIQAGEDFAVVATEVSTDTLSTAEGGDLGWVTTGQLSGPYGEDLESAAFGLEVGQPQLVPSNDQFYVILVLDRDENGPLPVAIVSQRQNSALADWLAERLASPDVEVEQLLEADQIPPDPFGSLGGSFTP